MHVIHYVQSAVVQMPTNVQPAPVHLHYKEVYVFALLGFTWLVVPSDPV